MAYHISNLGSFAGNRANPDDPAYYADLDGFVPQQGDRAEDFLGVFTNLEWWTEWVADAVNATAQAERRAREWSES